ncbi:MAG TPA: hypothetical protein VJR92_06320 [Gemmatimonadaceae bacterium]|nr:hypothetical protein [Gemmatimonadaceae bacterium]
MTPARQSAPGATRICPHCRQSILESSVICPACRKHLRFEPKSGGPSAPRSAPTFSPLRVEGTIRHPAAGEVWEYSMVASIRNGRGEEVARQVIGVGALQPDELRTFTVAVEVFAPTGSQSPAVSAAAVTPVSAAKSR